MAAPSTLGLPGKRPSSRDKILELTGIDAAEAERRLVQSR
jgi:hypothetical protein